MARKKTSSKLRNWAAVAAWQRKAGPHRDKRKKRETKYPKVILTEENI